MLSMFRWAYIGFVLLSIVSCTTKSEGDNAGQSPFIAADGGNPHFDLPQIQENGELIILTLYGPESYFEFHSENFGLQYMIANEFSKSIGTSIRVDVSKNQQELINKLNNGEGDIIACAIDINDSSLNEVQYVGETEMTAFLDSISRQRNDSSIAPKRRSAWAVRHDSPLLCSALKDWMQSNAKKFFDYTTIRIKTKSGRTYRPQRKVSAPILNAAAGQISVHDDIFKKNAITCGWDWRLIAAQAYQESAFDPQAVSYMGAMGLMQLMPSTARSVGVSQDDVFNPQHNVRGAVKLIRQLDSHYSSISDPDERINFILAAYNAGPGHVDDAREVAKKYGKNPNVWLGNVDGVVLRMSDADFFNLPEVKHGYFRGSETYNYVNSIRTRWNEYRRKIKK